MNTLSDPIEELYHLNRLPNGLCSTAHMKELLEEFGTVGGRVLQVRRDSLQVLTTLENFLNYMQADVDTFGYETEQNFPELLKGVEWIREKILLESGES